MEASVWPDGPWPTNRLVLAFALRVESEVERAPRLGGHERDRSRGAMTDAQGAAAGSVAVYDRQ